MLFSGMVYSGNIRSFYQLVQNPLGLSIIDVKYGDPTITKTKYSKLTLKNQPVIFFEQPIYNFGKVYKDENIEHAFIFKNRGTKELKINKIKASCGCIIGETTIRNIAPGDPGNIVVRFRSDWLTGPINKIIKVYSNDPETPVYTLRLIGEVIEDITVRPQQIKFGDISYGEKAEVELDIMPHDGFALKISDIISSNPAIITCYRMDEQKNKHLLIATLKGGTIVGKLTGNIYIYTNSEKQKEIIIPFSGEVLGDIRIYPPHLHYGVIKKGDEYAKSVFITLLNKDILVEKIEVRPEFLIPEIIDESSKKSDRREYPVLRSDFWEVDNGLSRKDINEKECTTLRVLINIKKDAPIGEINGVIKVHTDSKIQPVINVPVSGRICGE